MTPLLGSFGSHLHSKVRRAPSGASDTRLTPFVPPNPHAMSELVRSSTGNVHLLGSGFDRTAIESPLISQHSTVASNGLRAYLINSVNVEVAEAAMGVGGLHSCQRQQGCFDIETLHIGG